MTAEDLEHFDWETERRLMREDHTRRTLGEKWWARRSDALERTGYRLRPRFRADWVPSWVAENKEIWDAEDGEYLTWKVVMDTTRTSDGSYVFLKELRADLGTGEQDITAYLSSEPLSQAFLTFGKAVPFFTQIFEHNIAHRGCTLLNIVFDPSSMYPESFHPKRIDRTRDWKSKAKYFTRTQKPPRYYLVDFGLSRMYDPAAGPPLDTPIQGGDKSVPEHQNADSPKPWNPFFTGIYYIGNMIREEFTQ
ncbi:hypothetical protein BV25DRAFT_1841547, partial [Artomyces pyxidatus]